MDEAVKIDENFYLRLSEKMVNDVFVDEEVKLPKNKDELPKRNYSSSTTLGQMNKAYDEEQPKPPSRFVLRRRSTEILFRELPTRHKSILVSANPIKDFNNIDVKDIENEKPTEPVEKGPYRLLSALYGLHMIILSLVFTVSFTFAADLNLAVLDVYFLILLTISTIWLLGFQPLATSCNRRPSEFGYSKFSQTTNRWLKGVIFFFGLAIIVKNCLEVLVYVQETTEDCTAHGLGLANPIVQAIFVIAQINFLFKYSKACVQDKKGINRLGSMHLLATNLSMWILLIIHESVHHIEESSDQHYTDPHCREEEDHSDHDNNNTRIFKRNALGADTCICTTDYCDAISSAENFVYPFVVEFCLVASCMMYIVWKNVGTIPHACQKVIKPSYKFYSSYKGVLLGILVLVTAIIVVVVLGTVTSGIDHEEMTYCTEIRSLVIHNVFLSTLGALCIAACIAGFILFEKDKRPIEVKEHVNLDLILLLLSLFGSITINCFYILAVYVSMAHEGTFIWGAIYPVVDLIQGSIQVVFILSGLHREPKTSEESRDVADLVHSTYAKTQKTGQHLGSTLMSDLHPPSSSILSPNSSQLCFSIPTVDSGSTANNFKNKRENLPSVIEKDAETEQTSFSKEQKVNFNSTSSPSSISDYDDTLKMEKKTKRKRHLSEKSVISTTVVAKLKVSEPDSTRLMIRDIAMFLLVVNACMWLFLSLEETAFHLYTWPQQYYDGNSWAVIISVCGPLSIFFRMHSAACLFEIWSFA